MKVTQIADQLSDHEVIYGQWKYVATSSLGGKGLRRGGFFSLFWLVMIISSIQGNS